jgi:hypothetical protein
MTLAQKLVSVFIAWQVAATVVGAIPTLDRFGLDVTAPRTAEGSLRSHLTSVLDHLAMRLVRMHRITVAWTQPIRLPLLRYLDVTDQYVKWNMFSNPARFHEFVRIDYVVALPSGAIRVESELVYPASAPGQWRLLAAYFDSFTDKAFANGLERYRTREFDAEQRGTPLPLAEMSDDLQPFLRYYAERREQRWPAGARLERAEFWRGFASVPPPGQPWSEDALSRRRSAVQALADGLASPTSLSDSDIVWTRFAEYQPQRLRAGRTGRD